MKKIISMTLLIVLVLSLIGCESNSDSAMEVCKAEYPEGYSYEDYDNRHKVREENPVEDAFENSLNSFACNTASQLLKDKNENIMYSPLSLYYALAIMADGANRETQDELFDLLNVDDKDYLAQQCDNLYKWLYSDNDVSKLKIANSLWLDNKIDGNKVSFKKDFIDNAKENFYASLFSVDFSDKKTGQAIGEWISKNTNGTLEYDYNPSPEQIMSIINTIYFYDQWEHRFSKDKTKEDVFYVSDDEQVKCDFMNIEFGSAVYVKGDEYSKSYLGLKSAGMVFILPDEGVSVNELLATPEKIDEIFNGGEHKCGEVTWKVPKFSYDTSLDIKENLKALGISAPFDMDNADFTGISDSNPFISDIKQKTHIGLNEEGVEASAYTEILLTGCALPDSKAEMILDRPFIYGIIANNSSLLFVGVCNNPAEY